MPKPAYSTRYTAYHVDTHGKLIAHGVYLLTSSLLRSAFLYPLPPTAETDSSDLVGRIHPYSYMDMLQQLPVLLGQIQHRYRAATAVAYENSVQSRTDEDELSRQLQLLPDAIQQYKEAVKSKCAAAAAAATAPTAPPMSVDDADEQAMVDLMSQAALNSIREEAELDFAPVMAPALDDATQQLLQMADLGADSAFNRPYDDADPWAEKPEMTDSEDEDDDGGLPTAPPLGSLPSSAAVPPAAWGAPSAPLAWGGVPPPAAAAAWGAPPAAAAWVGTAQPAASAWGGAPQPAAAAWGASASPGNSSALPTWSAMRAAEQPTQQGWDHAPRASPLPSASWGAAPPAVPQAPQYVSIVSGMPAPDAPPVTVYTTYASSESSNDDYAQHYDSAPVPIPAREARPTGDDYASDMYTPAPTATSGGAGVNGGSPLPQRLVGVVEAALAALDRLVKRLFTNVRSPDATLDNMLSKVRSLWATLSSPDTSRSDPLFVFKHGPVALAAVLGRTLVLEDFNLPSQAVTERLNSLLEPDPSFTLTEDTTAGRRHVIDVVPGFQVLATAHVDSESSKPNLSPAVRSRFSEIFVPPYSDENLCAIATGVSRDEGTPTCLAHATGFHVVLVIYLPFEAWLCSMIKCFLVVLPLKYWCCRSIPTSVFLTFFIGRLLLARSLRRAAGSRAFRLPCWRAS